jgi:integrase
VSLNGKPVTGIRSTLNAVREFLKYNDIEFTEKQRKQLINKIPKSKRSSTEERDLDINILKKILTHMDLKSRALVLLLGSSGMRIGEALHITLEDINLNSKPVMINIRAEYTKNESRRTAFISNEAKEAVEEWLKIREQYLKSAENKANGLGRKKELNDNRIFPFTDINFRQSWDNALQKAGLYSKDKITNRGQYRVHALRKFFRSQLALSCPVDIVETLMGHEGYLTDAYRRYTQKQLGEHYLKAEHHVTVSGTADLHEIKDRLQDTQATVHGYKQIVNGQNEEIIALRTEMKELKEKLEDLETDRKIDDNAWKVLTWLVRKTGDIKMMRALGFDKDADELEALRENSIPLDPDEIEWEG